MPLQPGSARVGSSTKVNSSRTWSSFPGFGSKRTKTSRDTMEASFLFYNCSNMLVRFLIAVCATLSALAQPADLVLLNAHVVTLNSKQREAQAIAISAGRIAWVGANADARKRFPAARRMDLAGATVLPGIIDAHTHLLSLGESLMKLNLKDATTPEQVVERVRERVKSARGIACARPRLRPPKQCARRRL